ncbi:MULTISPECIES: 5'-methylthioadenosine/adenosylhomocysteine nucleosidase [unclassified Nitratiruptor]|uniref:5'-methylthioadenosine/adenosylhomocysteine nucleosidase n=1 Tax=unclassified Nitratiruptor TaxID=2624044 RepID=UPI00191501EB|nr:MULTISPECIES: 5'-methylthioadenosine/adenosylhomocysteine nucleosidase [unclassified Nitratiruptor]BCD60068.1 adenosylhomocysteine/aminodeoxyfutalosine nucleosidase [Nitratiruptor sp. YY08-10]BCD64443.1 adenosylhomocysteine/aminodeoxyfutalosine nucleosidase [Nitratiruptor sp. YY08-14]
MKIAIMGAMIEEIEPILSRLDSTLNADEPLEYIIEHMQNIKLHYIAGNRYFEAKYKGHEIIVAYSKIGKVYASLTANVLIQHFKVEKLLFSGVAGAISEDLHIGDLIMAKRLCQHDLDITAFGHPYGYVPEGKVYVESDPVLREIAKDVAKQMQVPLKEGTIATGDQFIADPKRKEWIQKTFDADALEMEGAAVAVVCDAFDIPFFILRSISDAADMDASFDFDTFLKSSSKRSAEFILKMVDAIIQ